MVFRGLSARPVAEEVAHSLLVLARDRVEMPR
jgi:hypothetical protein